VVSTVATIESDIGRLEREWEGLAERTGSTPFHDPAWVKAWWSAFGSGNLLLATVRRDGELTAAIPLTAKGSRIVSPTNWHWPLFGPVADDEESADRLLDFVFGLESRSVDLSLLDVDDGSMRRAVQAAERAGRLVKTRRLARSPWICLQGSWEDYERRLSKNRRKSIRRSLRRMQEKGAVTLHMHDGSEVDGLDGLLQEAFRLEASGWKGKRGTAIASRPDTMRFYTEVVAWATGKGMLRLAFLRLDGKPVAFDLSLERDHVRYSLKAGFDAEFASYGPGAVLLYQLLREAQSSGIERFELLGPEDSFKSGWSDHTSDRGWLHAAATSAAGRADAAVIGARERVRPLARRIRGWMES
jgi:CelD/BcsL family acetyltransferase involved in cellulose biosynthesis